MPLKAFTKHAVLHANNTGRSTASRQADKSVANHQQKYVLAQCASGQDRRWCTLYKYRYRVNSCTYLSKLSLKLPQPCCELCAPPCRVQPTCQQANNSILNLCNPWRTTNNSRANSILRAQQFSPSFTMIHVPYAVWQENSLLSL